MPLKNGDRKTLETAFRRLGQAQGDLSHALAMLGAGPGRDAVVMAVCVISETRQALRRMGLLQGWDISGGQSE